MSPITHMLVGWIALERVVVARRDKALLMLAAVAPDLDGVGIVVDFATRMLGLPPTDCYQAFHRLWGHGIWAALLIALIAAACARQRTRVALAALVCVHLHLLCDVVGSRGSGADDLWPIHYLQPLWAAWEWSWSGQWPLVGWQNIAISSVLMLWTMWRAARLGYSPVGLFSPRADAVFVAVLRQWGGRLRRFAGTVE